MAMTSHSWPGWKVFHHHQELARQEVEAVHLYAGALVHGTSTKFLNMALY